MSPKGKSTTTMVIAAVVAVVALVVLGTSLSSCGSSPRSFVRDRYTAAGKRNGTEVFRTNDRVERVVKDLTAKWKPADRLADTGGVFLRYRDELIAVRPRTAGGTEISVDDPERGYAHWYPYVGGWFGTYSGRAEGFRGGGPGTGK